MAARLHLGPEYGLCLKEGVAMRIVRTVWLGICIDFDNAVAVAIDVHVETRTEDVLVDVSQHTRRDLAAILAGTPRQAGRCIDDPGRLDLELDGTVPMEVSIETIIVIRHGADA
jgi:hypothetical protein